MATRSYCFCCGNRAAAWIAAILGWVLAVLSSISIITSASGRSSAYGIWLRLYYGTLDGFGQTSALDQGTRAFQGLASGVVNREVPLIFTILSLVVLIAFPLMLTVALWQNSGSAALIWLIMAAVKLVAALLVLYAFAASKSRVSGLETEVRGLLDSWGAIGSPLSSLINGQMTPLLLRLLLAIQMIGQFWFMLVVWALRGSMK